MSGIMEIVYRREWPYRTIICRRSVGGELVQLMIFLFQGFQDRGYVTVTVNHVYAFSDCEIVNEGE